MAPSTGNDHLDAVRLPSPALRAWIVPEDHGAYTPTEHTVWRATVKRLLEMLPDLVAPEFLPGIGAVSALAAQIPCLSELRRILGPMGGEPVLVRSYVPYARILELWAEGFLPINIEMRLPQHLGFTPSPDFIHGVIGHVSTMCDPTYRQFVRELAALGKRAFGHQRELELDQAMALHAKLSETEGTPREQIAGAQEQIDEIAASIPGVSEAVQVARLHWFTVETALVGDLSRPRLFGATLLSSFEEARYALGEGALKRPFDLEACFALPIAITHFQPMHFVIRDLEEVLSATRTLASRMAHRGGRGAVERAIAFGASATLTYSSGLEVGGIVSSAIAAEDGEAIYLRFRGPVSLTVGGIALPALESERSSERFVAPVGWLVREAAPLEDFDDAMLQRAGIVAGKPARLVFMSGIAVEGVVLRVLRHHGRLVLLSFSTCRVTRGGQVLSGGSQGGCEMAVGERIVAAYPGAAATDTRGAWWDADA